MTRPLIAISLILGGCAPLTLHRAPQSWPAQEGTIDVSGLLAPVSIHRDPSGVPHIRAESTDDMWFALGLSHAQDRLFQADLTRRFIYGGLSEWFGDDTVEVDTFTSLLQLRRLAHESYKGLSEEAQRSVRAYTSGFNAGARSLPALPVEYQLLDVPFAQWTPTDCMAVHLANAWFLSTNPGAELFALAARKKLNTEQLNAVLRPGGGPAIDLYWSSLVDVKLGAFNTDFLAFAGEIGEHPEIAASNAWAVSGDRTASGSALLASDPHLVQSVPSLWYFADLQSDALHVAGSTLAGAPGVPIGHNESLAWGLTNIMADTIDFAVLERHGPTGYIYQGHVKELIRRETTVKTPDGPVKKSGWFTEVGPVITDLNASSILSLRWAGLSTPDRTTDLLLNLNASSGVAEAIDATRVSSVLPMNLVLADASGQIGWTMIGSMPRRRGYSGRVPYPASIPGYDWQGWLDRLPSVVDPKEGFIASANNRPSGPIADAIGTSFMADWRVDRIRSQLEREGLSADDMSALQGDVFNGRAQTLLHGLIGDLPSGDERGTECARLLKEWDFIQERDRIGPTVWFYFERELLRVALEDRLGGPLFQDYLRQFHPGRNLLDSGLRELLPDGDRSIQRALNQACVALRADLGPDSSRWTWGAVHTLHLQHPFSTKSRFLDRRWSSAPTPYAGGSNTVNSAAFSLDGTPDIRFMTSMRLVVPLDDVKQSTYSHPGGASGHPTHPQSFNKWADFVEQKTSVLGFGPPINGPKLTLRPKQEP